MCVSVSVSFQAYTRRLAISGPIRTKFGTHMQIHLEKVVGKIKKLPCDLGGTWGVLGGQKLTNVGNLPIG